MSDRQFSIPPIDGISSRVMVDAFGDDDLRIEVVGKIVHFSFSQLFGPWPCTKTGRERSLGPRHPFWRAASLWHLQGSRVESGLAIWHEPKKPVLKHLGGRNYLVIEDGEPGHDW